MSGHSHWANIQHKKAANDKKKGKILSKLVKLIYSAVKEGKSGKPEDNPRLRLVLDKCRLANMSKDSIKRAIDKAATGAAGYEEMMFEGYGPEGVALVIECMTDNPQRTSPEIRYIFDRNNAKWGKPGSVSHMFQKKGVFHVDESVADEDALMEALQDAPLENIEKQEGFCLVTCASADFMRAEEAFLKANIATSVSEVQMIPSSRIEVSLEAARKLAKLIDILEEHDDVQNVYSNFDISEETARQMENDA
jgi:YebC/PmpR family DNA-binding regulatory protein